MKEVPQNLKLDNLITEQPNTAAADLDTKSALEIAQIINSEDAKVATAVKQTLPQIAQGIDAIANALKRGGRLIYIGSGTSGRIGALDASECPPTFQTDPRQVQFIVAGGKKTLYTAIEGAEDSRKLGEMEIKKKKLTKNDVVVGIAASGRTPFTIAAVEYARKQSAKTIALVCNKNSELGKAAEIEIVVEVGPEVVSGSTRMKAGTAQKMVANMLTTGAMTRLGYVYGNLMVNVRLNNKKLIERGITILQNATNVPREQARQTLKAARNSVPTAMVMLKTGLNRIRAEKALKAVGGNVRQAINSAK